MPPPYPQPLSSQEESIRELQCQFGDLDRAMLAFYRDTLSYQQTINCTLLELKSKVAYLEVLATSTQDPLPHPFMGIEPERLCQQQPQSQQKPKLEHSSCHCVIL